MAQKKGLVALALAGLVACAAPEPAVAPRASALASAAPPAPAPSVDAPPDVVAAPASLDDYKRQLAGRIVASSTKIFHEPLPATMKSVVVLHIRVDSRGRPLHVAVFRSNGYRALERRAMASVIMAMPLPAPPGALLDESRSLSFLETFLFRADGLFQVRSLVGESWKATAGSAARRRRRSASLRKAADWR